MQRTPLLPGRTVIFQDDLGDFQPGMELARKA
jgi:hypothetical protein